MQTAEDLPSAIDNVSAAQQALAKSIGSRASDDSSFDISQEIPTTYQALSALDSEITAIAQSIRGITEQDLTLVPFQWLESARNKFVQIAKHYNLASDKINNGIPIQSIAAQEYAFTDKDGNRQSISKDLETASNITEALLADWHLLRLAAKSPRINDFAAFLRLNSSQRENIEKSYQEIQEIKAKIESLSTSIETTYSEATEANEEINRLKSLVESNRKDISDFLSESSVKIEGIRKTSSDADALTETISEYQTEFDRFTGQLDERTKRINDGNNDLAKLIDRLTSQEETIKRLIEQSEAMLVGATNAGLAGSLSKRLVEITKEVGKARVAYYFAIALLICATIPIAVDIIPREFLQKLIKALSGGYIEIADPNAKPNIDLLGHVFARALLLIPPFLLVRFAAARHERLFRLREHYAYKYSIASSVEGFKQQSPEQYRDYVALVAFNELTFNPATQMEAKGAETKHPSPFIEAFLKKAGFSPEQQ